MQDIIYADEILLKIFSNLNVIDLKYARLVCHWWNRIALDFTLPLITSLKRDQELRRVLLLDGYLPHHLIPPNKDIFDLDKYALINYLSKNKQKEIIGYTQGNIVDKIQILASKSNNKRITIKKDESVYYNVVRLSWIIIRQLHRTRNNIN